MRHAMRTFEPGTRRTGGAFENIDAKAKSPAKGRSYGLVTVIVTCLACASSRFLMTSPLLAALVKIAGAVVASRGRGGDQPEKYSMG